MSSEECHFLDIDLLKHEFDEQDKRSQQLPEKLIDKMVVNSAKLDESLSLTDHKMVKHFRITRGCKYDENHKTPKLVNVNTIRYGVCLDKEFSYVRRTGKLINDYSVYRKKKWNYFLKCLRHNNLMASEKPCFVSYCGLIAGLMASVEDSGKFFRIYAQIFNGAIYLFVNKSVFGTTDKHSFCGLKFLYLMSDRRMDNINQYEKHFAVNTVKLGEHTILTLNEIDAIDAYGKPVELKTKKIVHTRASGQCFEKRKLLQTWCQCSVSGVNTILFGYRNANNCLEYFEEYETDYILDKCENSWSGAKCVDFLDRLLSFVKRCVTQEFVVYEFWYRKRDEFVRCKRYNPNISLNSFLPKWYVNGQMFQV